MKYDLANCNRSYRKIRILYIAMNGGGDNIQNNQNGFRWFTHHRCWYCRNRIEVSWSNPSQSDGSDWRGYRVTCTQLSKSHRHSPSQYAHNRLKSHCSRTIFIQYHKHEFTALMSQTKEKHSSLRHAHAHTLFDNTTVSYQKLLLLNSFLIVSFDTDK